MWTSTERLALWGTISVLGAVGIGGPGLRGGMSESGVPRTQMPAAGTETTTEQALEATRGELAVARLQIERAEAIIAYSSRYEITADLAAAVYDAALAEGIEPELGFNLVKVESNFTPTATSPAGAVGYTQVLPKTARLYEPGLTTRQLYSRTTNLRLGFRYLRDLLERYEGSAEEQLRLALLAYNRGPAKVQAILDAGHDPQNGYSTAVLKGYRRKG